ncbi:MAG: hypothetical protein P1U74_00710 [Legionellaceae bacterium]|nr:hypothetical protein [Legionellaceae bacterium]
MTDALLENLIEINRTDAALRSKINSKINDKRTVYEEMLIRSIKSLLNSNNTKLKLQEKQSLVDKLTTTRRKRNKAIFLSATESVKQSTAHAPMGIGSVGNIALSTVGKAGEVVFDEVEQRIAEEKAKENLALAEFETYTSGSDTYNAIAKTVARKSSFAHQLLLFVLSTTAIEKLIKFSSVSMKRYAVDRLPEYHSTNEVDEVVNALYDAMIPPIVDDRFYRDFFGFDYKKLKINLGEHIRLEVDEVAINLLRLAGMDAEMFFGSIDINNFTILGALNHATFLSQNYELHTGAENYKRSEEFKIGKLKYPLILLAEENTLGTIGVSFVPKQTGIRLEKPHIDLLHRLVPNFADPEATRVSEQELLQRKVILPDYSNYQYRSERNSVPWSMKRTIGQKERMATVLSACKDPIIEEEIVSSINYPRLKVMRDAGEKFDLNYTKIDAQYGASESEKSQAALFETLNDIDRKRRCLESSKYSRFLAIATSHYVNCIIKCESFDPEDLQIARNLLDVARTTLNISREIPLIESARVHRAKTAVKFIAQQVSDGESIQLGYYQNLQFFLQNLQRELTNTDIYLNQQRLLAWKIKLLSQSINDANHELSKIVLFIKALSHKNPLPGGQRSRNESEVIEDFQNAATNVLRYIYPPNPHSVNEIRLKIEIYAIETKLIHYEIIHIVDDAETRPDNHQQLLNNTNEALANINAFLIETETIIANINWRNKGASKRSLRQILSTVEGLRDLCKSLLTNIKLALNDSDIDEETRKFLARTKVYNEYGKILFLASKQEQTDELKQAVQCLNKTIISLYRASEETSQANLLTCEEIISVRLPQNVSITKYSAHARKLKLIKENMELSGYNDVDILSRAKQKSQTGIGELQTLIQEIKAADNSILAIIDTCEEELFIDSSVSLQESDVTQIKELRSLLVGDDSMKIDLLPYTSIILKIIKQIFKSNDLQAYDLDQHTSSSSKADDTRNNSLLTTTILLIDELLERSGSDVDNLRLPIKQPLATTNKIFSIQEDRQEIDESFKEWGVWIIAKLLRVTIKHITHGPHGLTNKLMLAQIALNSIKEVADSEPPELTKSRALAMKKIKHGYKYIYLATQQKSQLTIADCSHCISENILVTGTLVWASRPTFSELKYLDEKQESLRKQRLEDQQKLKRETFIINPLLIRYIKAGIEYLQTKQGSLTILKTNIKNSYDEIYRLQPPTNTRKMDKKLLDIKTRLNRLGQIVAKKLEHIDIKIQKLVTYKIDFTNQILSAYFTYLKLEIDILEQPIALRTVVSNKPEDLPSDKLSIGLKKKTWRTDQEASIHEAAEKYSITDLETEYTLLFNELKTHVELYYSKESGQIADSNSDRSDDRLFSPSRNPRKPFVRTFSSNSNSFYDNFLVCKNTDSNPPISVASPTSPKIEDVTTSPKDGLSNS